MCPIPVEPSAANHTDPWTLASTTFAYPGLPYVDYRSSVEKMWMLDATEDVNENKKNKSIRGKVGGYDLEDPTIILELLKIAREDVLRKLTTASWAAGDPVAATGHSSNALSLPWPSPSSTEQSFTVANDQVTACLRCGVRALLLVLLLLILLFLLLVLLLVLLLLLRLLLVLVQLLLLLLLLVPLTLLLLLTLLGRSDSSATTISSCKNSRLYPQSAFGVWEPRMLRRAMLNAWPFAEDTIRFALPLHNTADFYPVPTNTHAPELFNVYERSPTLPPGKTEDITCNDADMQALQTQADRYPEHSFREHGNTRKLSLIDVEEDALTHIKAANTNRGYVPWLDYALHLDGYWYVAPHGEPLYNWTREAVTTLAIKASRKLLRTVGSDWHPTDHEHLLTDIKRGASSRWPNRGCALRQNLWHNWQRSWRIENVYIEISTLAGYGLFARHPQKGRREYHRDHIMCTFAGLSRTEADARLDPTYEPTYSMTYKYHADLWQHIILDCTHWLTSGLGPYANDYLVDDITNVHSDSVSGDDDNDDNEDPPADTEDSGLTAHLTNIPPTPPSPSNNDTTDNTTNRQTRSAAPPPLPTSNPPRKSLAAAALAASSKRTKSTRPSHRSGSSMDIAPEEDAIIVTMARTRGGNHRTRRAESINSDDARHVVDTDHPDEARQESQESSAEERSDSFSEPDSDPDDDEGRPNTRNAKKRAGPNHKRKRKQRPTSDDEEDFVEEDITGSTTNERLRLKNTQG
ncbi:hypothetical protein B484DRAFT_399603 [Ochromonadaceae sp. CCMP2298]|nr:hypothetical protein B484DRAFT_399603 [Ochromonadaceae sp. CCMP2298]